MVHVPYKGSAQAVQDMMGSRVDVMFDNLSAARPHIDAGRLRPLAVSTQHRVPALPGVPTIEESGLVHFVGESWFGVFAPAATPAPVVARLRTSIAALIAHPAFIARVERDSGRTMPIPAGEQQAFLRSEAERWARLIAQYGVVAE
jgi:tripartite-type tricarboxylate transporter receptor subunit TctC